MSAALSAIGFMAVLTGLLAVVLALANQRLKVFEDPRVDAIADILPGNNCGACGQPGCRAFAEKVVTGDVAPGQCTPSGAATVQMIADYLGVDVGGGEKRVARLHCAGGNNVAVQLGYRHPFELSSCSSVFDKEHFYTYSGEHDRLETLSEVPEFVDATTLVEFGPLRELRAGRANTAAADAVRVPLRLVPVSGAQPRLVASRIPTAEAERLKRLIYLLPPAVLARYGICVTGDFIYLYCEDGIDFVPLGELFWSLAPGVFIPQGFSLLPRVAPEVLREHLGAQASQLFYFTLDAAGPLRFERSEFKPLGRHSLAQVVLREGTVAALPPEPELAALELVNDEIGLFPLWSFDAEVAPERRLEASPAVSAPTNDDERGGARDE